MGYTETLAFVLANLMSPVVLCFMLGIVATLLKSDLTIPEPIYSILTIYLLFALGLKGGVELSSVEASLVVKPALATLALGIVTPGAAYLVSRYLGKLSRYDAAALAAHYGSVSVVTFIAAQSFLNMLAIPVEGFVSTLVVILEIPAIVMALALARMGELSLNKDKFKEAIREVLTGKSILLLVGGLVIGFLAKKSGYAKVEPFFGPPFQGAVALFLLEMGIVASKRFRDIGRSKLFLLLFGTLVPVFNGFIGVTLGVASGLGLGGSVILGTLGASASYIAAPAAVRIAIPEASPGIYLTAALTVTFPFNLLIGIPIYLKFAQWYFQN